MYVNSNEHIIILSIFFNTSNNILVKLIYKMYEKFLSKLV